MKYRMCRTMKYRMCLRSSPISALCITLFDHSLNSASIRYFTMELLQDPVVAADGFTCTPTTPLLPRRVIVSVLFRNFQPLAFSFRYERRSIARWFALGHTSSPKSGQQLSSTALIANHDLRTRVQEWVQVGGRGRGHFSIWI